jgi:hypothetical protein
MGAVVSLCTGVAEVRGFLDLHKKAFFLSTLLEGCLTPRIEFVLDLEKEKD